MVPGIGIRVFLTGDDESGKSESMKAHHRVSILDECSFCTS